MYTSSILPVRPDCIIPKVDSPFRCFDLNSRSVSILSLPLFEARVAGIDSNALANASIANLSRPELDSAISFTLGAAAACKLPPPSKTESSSFAKQHERSAS